jgi:hypothetical protein
MRSSTLQLDALPKIGLFVKLKLLICARPGNRPGVRLLASRPGEVRGPQEPFLRITALAPALMFIVPLRSSLAHVAVIAREILRPL